MSFARFAGLSIAALSLLAANSTVALSQTYPSRTITFVVPFAPGGLSDVPARIVAAEMQARLGQSIVIENRPGASGIPGATYVLKAEPDGYTILVNALSDVQNLHYLSVPYSAVNDFAMVGMIADGPPLVLIVNSKSPYKSVSDIVADAKANPTKVSFGSSGPATSPAIAITQLNALAKTTIAEVAYRGSGPAAQAVLTGEVQGAFSFMANARQFHDDGQARALAITKPQRFERWPELPTMGEQGFPGFDHGGFAGLAAPGKTPASVIAVLNKSLNDVLAMADVRKKIEALGMTPPDPKSNTPEALKAYMVQETARQAELAKLTGHRK